MSRMAHARQDHRAQIRHNRASTVTSTGVRRWKSSRRLRDLCVRVLPFPQVSGCMGFRSPRSAARQAAFEPPRILAGKRSAVGEAALGTIWGPHATHASARA